VTPISTGASTGSRSRSDVSGRLCARFPPPCFPAGGTTSRDGSDDHGRPRRAASTSRARYPTGPEANQS
jgi:hypothetical protein